MNKFKIGQRVAHDGHGNGIVVSIRQTRLEEADKLIDRVLQEEHAQSIPISSGIFYGADRFPYIVRFDSTGYEDVYAESELSIYERGV